MSIEDPNYKISPRYTSYKINQENLSPNLANVKKSLFKESKK